MFFALLFSLVLSLVFCLISKKHPRSAVTMILASRLHPFKLSLNIMIALLNTSWCVAVQQKENFGHLLLCKYVILWIFARLFFLTHVSGGKCSISLQCGWKSLYVAQTSCEKSTTPWPPTVYFLMPLPVVELWLLLLYVSDLWCRNKNPVLRHSHICRPFHSIQRPAYQNLL